eukprot:CAMPEP_0198735838 /NCGR_PEP_ID=MMETSP1475-20131203/62005_1 /TAXON_ID= ORGANISM="Unidentified sp., Strain CCMP1999" /NCGR_SAMPLE_ID=MMETSP1475 /ASSEMBLY_ACC=CAM_ASM_001111 /LENGTH=325 /DNA_ID=CAMNT_0044499561 /DNA_START=324 /DNA_END=1299 /DNA_ORIENTATION=+
MWTPEPTSDGAFPELPPVPAPSCAVSDDELNMFCTIAVHRDIAAVSLYSASSAAELIQTSTPSQHAPAPVCPRLDVLRGAALALRGACLRAFFRPFPNMPLLQCRRTFTQGAPREAVLTAANHVCYDGLSPLIACCIKGDQNDLEDVVRDLGELHQLVALCVRLSCKQVGSSPIHVGNHKLKRRCRASHHAICTCGRLHSNLPPGPLTSVAPVPQQDGVMKQPELRPTVLRLQLARNDPTLAILCIGRKLRGAVPTQPRSLPGRQASYQAAHVLFRAHSSTLLSTAMGIVSTSVCRQVSPPWSPLRRHRTSLPSANLFRARSAPS